MQPVFIYFFTFQSNITSTFIISLTSFDKVRTYFHTTQSKRQFLSSYASSLSNYLTLLDQTFLFMKVSTFGLVMQFCLLAISCLSFSLPAFLPPLASKCQHFSGLLFKSSFSLLVSLGNFIHKCDLGQDSVCQDDSKLTKFL